MLWPYALVGAAIAYAIRIERMFAQMGKSKAELDAAIDTLPASITTAVVTALQPVIADLIAKNKQTPVDFLPEIDKLNNIGPAVSSAVAAAIDPPPAQTPPANTGTGGTDTPPPDGTVLA